MKKNQRRSGAARTAFAAAISSLLLIGCTKPPACGDEETLGLARDVIAKNIRKGLTALSSNDPAGLIDQFVKGAQIKFSRIVSEGYKEDAKKQMCSAQMQVTSPAGELDEVPVHYATQLTEDKDARFAIEVGGAHETVQTLIGQAREHYVAHRWEGEWIGTYRCGGIDGAGSGPRGPFSQRVTLVVKGTDGHMQRTAAGGGYERIGGNFILEPGGKVRIELGGPGKNSPTDGWIAEFAGPVEGSKLTIDGVIRLIRSQPGEEEQVLRRCQLELAQAAAGAQPQPPAQVLRN